MRVISILIIAILIIQSCSREEQISFVFPIRYDMEVFTDFIDIKNYHPKSIQWVYVDAPCTNDNRLPCPNDYRIEAILIFEKKDLLGLKKGYLNSKLPIDECHGDFNFNWLDKSIKNKIKKR